MGCNMALHFCDVVTSIDDKELGLTKDLSMNAANKRRGSQEFDGTSFGPDA
jgi:hypothetical protein